MIGKLIAWCVHHGAMVMVMTVVLIVAGLWAATRIKVDAIPDLSDVQVIIRTEYAGQAPQIVEDQVTYPLTTSMLSVPYARDVRGISLFGVSYVYIIFEDGTDLYWARSRVLEQLSFVSSRLPANVTPQLGPDATGVGWVYQYALVTGKYCPKHPNGLWHDPLPGAEKWYATRAEAGEEAGERLAHRRVFEGRDTCPLDGEKLVEPQQDLSDLRGLQDWYLRYELAALPGVSEVASVGGFVKQYQVVVDPAKLQAFDLGLMDVEEAIRRSNADVGGAVIEQGERELMVRGRGYLGTLSEEEIARAHARGESVEELRTRKVVEDLERVAVGVSKEGSPVYLSSVAMVRVGPEMRRGIAEWNGEGEAVGGVIVMRFGENARATIASVKEKLEQLSEGLPGGVGVEVAYDRSDLIDRAVGTLRHSLFMEITVVALVCIVFLLHARSELVAVFVVPTGVLVSLLAMHLLGINANVMSLGGIAIAIGVMVDSSIVMVENAHKHLDREEERRHRAGEDAFIPTAQRTRMMVEAAQEVGPSLFFSLLIITVSFMPVFVLGEQSGRLFKPLAYTKTFAMAAAAFLAVTIIPVLMTFLITSRVLPKAWGWRRNLGVTLSAMLIPAGVLMWIPLGEFEKYRLAVAIGWAVLMGMLLIPQKIIHEQASPISRFLQRVYHPAFVAVMRFKWLTLGLAIAAMLSIIWPLKQLGSEFMPPLEEGDLLYMPTTDPGLSASKARELLQQTDRIIRQFPEVESVFGKVGAAESATDPAPLNMFETTVMLHRDHARWRRMPVERFFDGWPGILRGPLSWVWATERVITQEELVYGYELPGTNHVRVPGLNDVLQIPGLTNSWTMPIRTRIDMLSTGIKTPVGVKVMGPDLNVLAELSQRIAQVIKTSEGTGPYTTSAYAEKSVGGTYLDIVVDREAMARYGLKMADVQEVIAAAMGGMNIGSTVEGLQRYPINLRYPQELREDVGRIGQTLVMTPGGAQVPLAQVARFEVHPGPDMVKSENARLTSWVYVDIAGIDVGTYVKNAQEAVAEGVRLPAGYSVVWSGQYQYMQEARQRLMVAVPLALAAILVLLYLATHSWLRVAIVCLAMPFSLVGAIWFLWWLDYEMSLAVWVGVIALAGLDAETGLVMLLYLDNSYERFKGEGRMRGAEDLWRAVHDGAVMRIRPKTMTVATTFIGLAPLLWADGAGADTMRRLAAPMIGGLATSFGLELLIYPVIFYLAKWVGHGGFRAGAGAHAENL